MALKIAILASGSGTNAAKIISLCQNGKLQAEVCLVISNRPKAKVLERAKELDVPYLALDHEAFTDRLSFDKYLIRELQKVGCGLVVLAGYMRLLTSEFLKAFPYRVVNIHPALLPSFPGVHGASDALDYGVKISGATVHFVEEKMDAGPVIIQAALPVMAGESAEELQNRIHFMEYKIYPQAIQWISQGRLKIVGRQVFLKDSVSKIASMENNLVWPPLEDF